MEELKNDIKDIKNDIKDLKKTINDLKEIIENDLVKSSKKLDKHIDFVENIYSVIKNHYII